MFPYSYDCKARAPNHDALMRISKAGVDAVRKVHQTGFAYGPICKTIYVASGSSVDWAYDSGKVPFPIAIELRDTGRYGFLLPPRYIIPSGEEMLEGVKAMSLQIMKEMQLDLR